MELPSRLLVSVTKTEGFKRDIQHFSLPLRQSVEAGISRLIQVAMQDEPGFASSIGGLVGIDLLLKPVEDDSFLRTAEVASDVHIVFEVKTPVGVPGEIILYRAVRGSLLEQVSRRARSDASSAVH